MEEEAPKICPNCKRDIPASNFTIHQVHCARNIRMCPVCKEPVPQAELQDHHDKMHKLLPCKQCGESVCGTDLEDHIRDSCALTIKSCRFCELELPRRDLPAHEGYCGVRTEQCPDCREWVMIKYRQLHLDSNHGFLRLDDDPQPMPTITLPSTSGFQMGGSQGINLMRNRLRTQNRETSNPVTLSGSSIGLVSGFPSRVAPSANEPQRPQRADVTKVPLKRTNDQPQINTAVTPVNKVDKDLINRPSRGAVKKRAAPPPPAQPPANPVRDLPYYSALGRQQAEEQERITQTAINIAAGLPPVLSAAAKLDKLRKIDALHNREVEDKEYKNKLQGRVWASPIHAHGNVIGGSSSVGHSSSRVVLPVTSVGDNTGDFRDLIPMTAEQFRDRCKELQNADDNHGHGRGSVRRNRSKDVQDRDNLDMPEGRLRYGNERHRSNGLRLDNHRPEINEARLDNDRQERNGARLDDDRKDRNGARLDNDREARIGARLGNDRQERNVANLYNDLQRRNDERLDNDRLERNAERLDNDRQGRNDNDRIGEIKSSLSQLRRGLNQIIIAAGDQNEAGNFGGQRVEEDEAAVRLPCEFCGVGVPLDQLVQHQTGCRPDLAQLRVRSSSESSPSSASPASPVPAAALQDPDIPLIPCEFCGQPLPVYLLTEHQQRCGDVNDIFYPD